MGEWLDTPLKPALESLEPPNIALHRKNQISKVVPSDFPDHDGSGGIAEVADHEEESSWLNIEEDKHQEAGRQLQQEQAACELA